jgi:hypothetical protein
MRKCGGVPPRSGKELPVAFEQEGWASLDQPVRVGKKKISLTGNGYMRAMDIIRVSVLPLSEMQ